jgi:5-methylcytosine-specific restriction endonuclease McrA
VSEPVKRTRRQSQSRRSEAKRKKPKIMTRDGAKCRYCDAVDNLTIDHLVPLSKGGSNAQSNLGIACHGCNADKGNKTEDQFRAVLARRQRPRLPVLVEYRRKRRPI